MQLNKEELVKRMKELEQARDAILSLRPSATKEFMDSYLMDTCPLASANRSNMKLSVNQSFQIDEVVIDYFTCQMVSVLNGLFYLILHNRFMTGC